MAETEGHFVPTAHLEDQLILRLPPKLARQVRERIEEANKVNAGPDDAGGGLAYTNTMPGVELQMHSERHGVLVVPGITHTTVSRFFGAGF